MGETDSESSTARVSRSASRGALCGALAGLIAAGGDWGAQWLWMPWWVDRLELFLRLVATEVPIGAAVGALLGLWGAASASLVARAARRLGRGDAARTAQLQHRLWPVPFVLLASPAIAWIAWMLFTGGMASRLPARPLLVGVAGLVLAVAVYVAVRLGRALFDRARAMPRRRAQLVAVGLLAVNVGLAKVDQIVLPNLYGYLHAALAATGFLVAGLAVLVLSVRSPRVLRLDRRQPRFGLVLVTLLLGVLTADVLTLDSNQNVRVALLEPRAATSRSLMQGLAPLLALTSGGVSDDALARAREARERRRAALAAGGPAPVLEGAHVLLITVDALRADHLGLYGYERPLSPNLDRLAAESIVFERAYAQAPHSSYSLCSLMTSEYLHDTTEMGHPLPEETLATSLAAEGYHTAGFYTLGIFHTEGERLTPYHDGAFGFARHEHRDVDGEPKTDEVLGEMERVVERGEPPTLFWVHYFDAHEPYEDTHFGTADVDRYDGEIRKADRAIGRLLREARARLARDLVVVITADHGEEFRDHGGVYHGSTLYDEQVRVPLIVHVPGLAARRVPTPVELIDVAPTLLSLVGVAPPPTMRGDDLRPLLTGTESDYGPVFASVTYKHMVVQWPYKLIADLRFSTFELYDLASDPRERQNLAARQPELLETLKGEVYAWIDSLQEAAGDPYHVALHRGRARDRRAVPGLAELVADEGAERAMRTEAAQILGGLADPHGKPALVRAMRSSDPIVAAEAAIALGRLYDERARPALHRLVYSEDPRLRTDAAISLARLRDRASVPGLIDAIWLAANRQDREEAIRWLGRLRDPRAVEPLLGTLADSRLRYLSVISLGQIGDRRAYEPLVDMLRWATHASVRDNIARALGQLGDPRGVADLVRLGTTEPDIGSAGESLVRLGAVGASAIGGSDVAPDTPGLSGFGRCAAGPFEHDWNYLQRTHCTTSGSSASIRMPVPEAVRRSPHGVLLLLRLRRADAGFAVPVQLAVGGVPLETVEIDGQWTEHRIQVPTARLGADAVRLTLSADGEAARLGVDHALLLPIVPPIQTASL